MFGKSKVMDCANCGQEISKTVQNCPFCGVRLAKLEEPGEPHVFAEPQPPRRNIGLALLSVFFPGAGQVWTHSRLRGAMWFLATAVGYICFIIPGLIIHFLCVRNALRAPDPFAEAEPATELDPLTEKVRTMFLEMRAQQRGELSKPYAVRVIAHETGLSEEAVIEMLRKKSREG